MGDQGQLFYEFRLGDAVPEDHLARKIDTALDLSWLRSDTPFRRWVARRSIPSDAHLSVERPQRGSWGRP